MFTYKNSDFCQICLRSDRTLRRVDNRLTKFHDALCEFKLEDVDPEYCSICEHLLKKLYNFKLQCIMAVQIIKSQKSKTGFDRTPLHLLYMLLPPSSIAVCDRDHYYEEVTKTEEVLEEPRLLNSLEQNPVPKPPAPRTYCNRKLEDKCLKLQRVKDVLKIKLNNENAILNVILVKKDGNLTANAESLKVVNGKPAIANANRAKPSLADLANITINSEDLIDTESVKQIIPKRKVLKDGSGTNDIPRKKTKKDISKLNKEGQGGEYEDAELDMLYDSTFHVKDGVSNMPFDMEKLIEDLKALFETCGEVEAPDGTVIDKEFILSSLHDKVAEFKLKLLWKFVHGRPCLMNQTTKILKIIQNKLKHGHDDIISTEYLNTKEKMLEEFQRRKTYDSYVYARHKCDICYQGFKLEPTLRQHMKCHEESAGDYVCSLCSARMKTTTAFSQHRSNHEAVYMCKLCPVLTHNHNVMIQHAEKHKGKVWICDMCGSKFSSASGWFRHIKYSHPLPHVCTTCGDAFFSPTTLKWHKTREHKGILAEIDPATALHCAHCNLAFPSEKVYNKHLNISHRMGPEFEAERAKPKLPRTRKTKKKIRNLTCRVCNVVAENDSWLAAHYSSEHPDFDRASTTKTAKTFLCDTCGKEFKIASALRDHMNLHTGALPYGCAICPKRFARKIALYTHRDMHLPPRYKCNLCGRMFHSPSNLNTHLRRHRDERRFKCQMCGKAFKFNFEVTSHIRAVHFKITPKRNRRSVTKKKAQLDPTGFAEGYLEECKQENSVAYAEDSVAFAENSVALKEENSVVYSENSVAYSENSVAYSENSVAYSENSVACAEDNSVAYIEEGSLAYIEEVSVYAESESE